MVNVPESNHSLPLRTIALVMTTLLEIASRVALLETIVRVPVPRALLLPRPSVPALTRTPPEKLLDEESPCTPVPVFTRPPVPVMSPLKVPLPLLFPRVSVEVPRETVPPVEPPPLRATIVWLKFARSSVAPATLEKVTEEFVEIAPTAPARSVP